MSVLILFIFWESLSLTDTMLGLGSNRKHSLHTISSTCYPPTFLRNRVTFMPYTTFRVCQLTTLNVPHFLPPITTHCIA